MTRPARARYRMDEFVCDLNDGSVDGFFHRPEAVRATITGSSTVAGPSSSSVRRTRLHPDIPAEVLVEVARHLLALDWHATGRFCSRTSKGLRPVLADALQSARLAHYRDSYAAMLAWFSAPLSRELHDKNELQLLQFSFHGPSTSWRDDGIFRLGCDARFMLEYRKRKGSKIFRRHCEKLQQAASCSWPAYQEEVGAALLHDMMVTNGLL